MVARDPSAINPKEVPCRKNRKIQIFYRDGIFFFFKTLDKGRGTLVQSNNLRNKHEYCFQICYLQSQIHQNTPPQPSPLTPSPLPLLLLPLFPILPVLYKSSCHVGEAYYGRMSMLSLALTRNCKYQQILNRYQILGDSVNVLIYLDRS